MIRDLWPFAIVSAVSGYYVHAGAPIGVALFPILAFILGVYDGART